MWTILGQTGKAMDATERTLAAIGAENPRVVFRSLAADTLSWQVLLDGLAPSAEIIPEAGQEVELRRSGARFFCGTVTSVRQTGRVVSVEAANAWWWLERVFLESLQTDGTGATGTRATYALPEQDLDDSFAALANAAIALGVPMQLGALAATFAAPPLRLAQMSFAQALAEVARVTPDLVTWFDYSASGLPALRTARRLTAATTTVDAETVEAFDVRPLTELQVSVVSVPYLSRAASGAKKFEMQTAGTAASGVPGGRAQILTVSGDEMDTFLPIDLLDSAEVWSYYHPTPSLLLSAYVWERDPSLGQAVGIPTYGAGVIGDSLTYYTNASPLQSQTRWFSGFAARKADGTVLPSLAGWYVLAQDDVDDWVLDVIGGFRATLSGTWIATWRSANGPWPAWFSQLQTGATTGAGYAEVSFGQLSGLEHWLARPFEVSCVLAPGIDYADRLKYKPADYGFVNPPAGFAAGLLAAQNYVPYEGQIEIAAEECGAARYLATGINLSNAMTGAASMKAMLSSEELDLDAGLTTLVLGPPERFSYRDLVNRLRGSSNDNIVYL
jgi:hypothetical protein